MREHYADICLVNISEGKLIKYGSDIILRKLQVKLVCVMYIGAYISSR